MLRLPPDLPEAEFPNLLARIVRQATSMYGRLAGQDPEDIQNETVKRFLQRLEKDRPPRFENTAQLASYLRSTARNVFLDVLRQACQKHRSPFPPELALEERATVDQEDIDAALKPLSSLERAILLIKFGVGGDGVELTDRQVAEKLQREHPDEPEYQALTQREVFLIRDRIRKRNTHPPNARVRAAKLSRT